MFLNADNKIRWKLLVAAVAVLVPVVVAGVLWFDEPLYLVMRKLDCRLWRIVDTVFDAKVWLAASALTVLVFYVKKSLKTKVKFKNERGRFSLPVMVRDCFAKVRYSYAFLTFCSVLGACIVAEVLKIVIGRFRPIFFEALDMTGFYPFSTEWAFNSMPSGHAAATFAGLVMLGLLAPRIKWATWTVAIIVGASRVAYGAHWPTDVLFGAFIGMVAADLTKAYLTHGAAGDKK